MPFAPLTSEIIIQLDRVAARLLLRVEDNFRAWTQIHLWPERFDSWEALADNLCQTSVVLEGYLALIEEDCRLFDADLWETVRRWRLFRDFRAKSEGQFLSREGLRELQRRVWPLLDGFAERHRSFVELWRGGTERPNHV